MEVTGYSKKAAFKDAEIMSYMRRFHARKATAILSADIESIFDLSGAEVRAIFVTNRLKGEIVVGHGNGYWFTEDTTEILTFVDSQESRIKHISSTNKAMRERAAELTAKNENLFYGEDDKLPLTY